MIFDRAFNLVLLAVLITVLYIAWGLRDNGRYVYQARTNRAQDVLVDTRTGRLYYLNIGNQGRKQPRA